MYLHVSERSLLSVVFLWLLQIARAFSLLLVVVLWCKNVGLDVVCGVNPHPILNGNGAGSENNLDNIVRFIERSITSSLE